MKCEAINPVVCGLIVAMISFTAPGWAAAPSEKVLYAFQSGIDGNRPIGGLILDASGNLYGTTAEGGGPENGGTVFELSPTASGWTETTLYSFQTSSGGAEPDSTLVMDGAGNLYGTTFFGPTGNCVGGCGVVFELMRPTNGGPWTETVLYSFQGGSDGAYPGGLIFDRSGDLYGTTSEGGILATCGGSGCGTVFELSPTAEGWALTTLYSFQGGTDGGTPAGLAKDAAGDLYGVTSFRGSAKSLGTVYELHQANGEWFFQVLYAFQGYGTGFQPSSPPVFSSQGYLVGTAFGGSPNGCCGLVFALLPQAGGDWTEVVPFRFNGKDGGGGPVFPLPGPVFDSHENLYGAVTEGGQYGQGVAYQLKRKNGTVTETYYSFCAQTGCPDGAGPESGVILDSSGNLYGTTTAGGLGYGVVYEITR